MILYGETSQSRAARCNGKLHGRMKQMPSLRTISSALREDLDLPISREREINVYLQSVNHSNPLSRADFILIERDSTDLSPSYFVSTATFPERNFVAREHVPGFSVFGTYSNNEISEIGYELRSKIRTHFDRQSQDGGDRGQPLHSRTYSL